jgi:hypothetical protein
MASTHKHIRSGTANKRPTTAIADGQIALNTNSTSPGLFFKDSTGATIIKIGPVHVGATAPNVSPAAGGSSGNSTGEIWLDNSLTPVGVKIWNGSAWVNATPIGSTTVQGLLELATDAETQAGSDTARAVTPASLQSKVSDSTSTTSSTTIASSTAVKSAHDLANAALPKSGGTVTGNLEIGNTGSLSFEGATADGFETTIAVTDPTADRTITLPDTTGTVVLNTGAQTVQFGLGAAATPSITFTGDTNTGIYSPGADQVAISTNGTGRLFVDSSGRLLVGTSTARVNFQNSSVTSRLQIEANDYQNASLSIITNDSSAVQRPVIYLYKSNGNSIGSNGLVANNDLCGQLIFGGNDGSEFVNAATIETYIDGTPGANDMPGRLVFSTTADGASSPTERMRIDSTGKTTITKTGDNVAGSAALDITTTGYAASDGSGPHYGIKVSQSGARYHLNYGVYSEVANTIGYFGSQVVDGMNLRGCGVYGFSPNSTDAYQASIGVYGKTSNEGWNYNAIYGIKGYALPGTTTFGAASSVLQAGYGGHFLSTGKGNCIGVYADAYLDASPGAGTEAVPLLVASNSTERFRVTSGGTTTLTSAASTAPFIAKIGSSEVSRIDSSGRLLVGTSTARSNFFNGGDTASIQLEGANGTNRFAAQIYGQANNFGPYTIYAKHRGTTVGGTTVVVDADEIGGISFQGSDGTDFVEGARITAFVDGTPGANDMPGRLVFSTTPDGASLPTERMRITNAGKILLNATSTTYAAPTFGTRGEIEQTIATYNNGDVFVRFCSGTQGSASLRGYIETNGVSVLYSTASDARLKENIADAPAAGSLVDAVQVRSFDWKESGIHQEYGFVAQELLEVYPHAVSQPSSDDEERPLAVDYSQLVPLLVKEVQALRARVAALEGA